MTATLSPQKQETSLVAIDSLTHPKDTATLTTTQLSSINNVFLCWMLVGHHSLTISLDSLLGGPLADCLAGAKSARGTMEGTPGANADGS